MAMREATPGAMKLPQGIRDKERVQLLEDRLTRLEAMLGASAAPGVAEDTKDALVAKAASLGLGAPSQLARWGVEKLKAAITEAEG